MARTNIATSTLAGTIAFRNTDLASKFLMQAGYGPSRSPEEVAYKLNNYIVQHGEAALEALAEIHPDREVIASTIKANVPSPQIENMNFNGNQGFHNCSGCSMHSNCNGNANCNCNKGNNNFNATGNEPAQLRSAQLLDQKSIMMIGLFCVTAISIIALTKKGN